MTSRRTITSLACLALCALILAAPGAASAATTAAGTVVTNQAVANFSFDGVPVTRLSNIESFTVQELLNHSLTTADVANVPVASGGSSQVLTFRLENTGNGSDSYSFTNSLVPVSDFTPSPMEIYFDTNGSGVYDAGDTLYVPTSNEPVLAAGDVLMVFVVSDIPLSAVEGNVANIQLDSTSEAGTGAVGTVLVGQGDGGTDAIVGPSQGAGSAISTYEVQVTLSIVKSAVVTDPWGGNLPVSGATVEYTITASVTGSGTLSNVRVNDQVPGFTTYEGGSLFLNAVGALTDAPLDDAGDFDSTISNGISVYVGDMDASSGTKTIRFRVTID